MPGNYTAYKFVAQLKYMMTAADSKDGSTEREECVSQDPAARTTSIQKGVCESQGYRGLRSAGFIFSAVQPNAQPLDRCYSEY